MDTPVVEHLEDLFALVAGMGQFLLVQTLGGQRLVHRRIIQIQRQHAHTGEPLDAQFQDGLHLAQGVQEALASLYCPMPTLTFRPNCLAPRIMTESTHGELECSEPLKQIPVTLF